jgi:hypothetical protein
LDCWKISIKYFKLDVTPAYASKRPHDWFKETLRVVRWSGVVRCGRRWSGLPARLIVTLFAILSGANLNNGSLQSLTTKTRI